MKILITAATQFELDAAVNSRCEGKEKIHTTDLLVTGLGSVATAYNLTKALARSSYDLIFNIGIAGSFSAENPIGSVIVVKDDCFADLGVYENNRFTSVFDMGLLSTNQEPFTNSQLSCPYTDKYPITQSLQKAKAVTVNTITSTAERVKELECLFSPDVESMEGAAFSYVCLCEGIPFLQIRSISNMVGVRDKAQWNIPLALENLGKTISGILCSI